MKKYLFIFITIFLLFGADILEYISSIYPNFESDVIDYINRLIKDIPIIFLFTILTFLTYKYLIKLIVIKQKILETEIKIEKHFGSKQNIGVAGITGSHKTSSIVFFIQVIEANKIRKRIDKIYYIKNKLHFVDFNLIDNFINNYFDYYKAMSDRDWKVFAAACLINTGYHHPHKPPILINTAFKTKSIIEMIADYIESYYILNIRKSNVISNVSVYSENTGQKPFIIRENYFTIFKNFDFKIEKDMIILDDEKGVLDNYKTSMKRDAKSLEDNDDGKSEFWMLIRHPFDGTTIRFGIQQNLADFQANQRRQYQCILNMDSNDQIITFDFEKVLINRLINYLDKKEYKYYQMKLKLLETFKKPNKTYFKLAFKIHGYLDRPNNWKFVKSKLFNLLDFFENKEILIERTSLYMNPDDVGKDLHKDDPTTKALAYPLTFIIPKNRTWSYYNTYSYKNIFNDLKSKTKGSILTTRQFKSITPSGDDFKYMNYKALQRIDEKINTKDKAKTTKKTKNPDYTF